MEFWSKEGLGMATSKPFLTRGSPGCKGAVESMLENLFLISLSALGKAADLGGMGWGIGTHSPFKTSKMFPRLGGDFWWILVPNREFVKDGQYNRQALQKA